MTAGLQIWPQTISFRLIWLNHTDITVYPKNMHTVFALLCFGVVIHRLIFPYPSGLLHWHCGNLTIAPGPAKQPWWIWINTSCEFIMNDCITTTKQSTTKPCAYFFGYTVYHTKLHLEVLQGSFCARPDNQSLCCIVMQALIGCGHTQNNSCLGVIGILLTEMSR